MTEEIKEKYSKVIEVAKENGIKTIEELQDIISEHFEECTGADFEIIKNKLKIKRF